MTGGAGGGVAGLDCLWGYTPSEVSRGGSATKGGSGGRFSSGYDLGESGGFGYGGGASGGTPVGGGGGGWFGGGSGFGCGGGGGSGYVLTSSSYKPSGYKLGSEYYLSDAQTMSGNQSFPAPGGGTETGHSGNGYARITLVE